MKRRDVRGMSFLQAIVLLIVLAGLALAAYVILGRGSPGVTRRVELKFSKLELSVSSADSGRELLQVFGPYVNLSSEFPKIAGHVNGCRPTTIDDVQVSFNQENVRMGNYAVVAFCTPRGGTSKPIRFRYRSEIFTSDSQLEMSQDALRKHVEAVRPLLFYKGQRDASYWLELEDSNVMNCRDKPEDGDQCVH
jgi:hypothetical protein